jgi:hypothetical protein
MGTLTRKAARIPARRTSIARQLPEIGVLVDPPASVGGSVLFGGVAVSPPPLS